MKKNVKRNSLGPLTPNQRHQLAALAAKPDAQIDYSDIPPLSDSFWKNAVRNPFYQQRRRLTW
jgi:hypothetical protein